MAKISTFILLCLIRIHANGYVLPECKINIITRAEWGARPPKAITNLRVPVPEFFVHHTDTPECFDVKACSAAVRSIQDFHMDERGWNDIGYNFLVGEDGNVYEGRGWDHVGAHTKGYNSKSLGTSVIGNYTAKLPNQKALTALKTLIACGVEEKKLIPNYRLYGHRDAGKTSCPGDALYKLIQTWPHYSHEPPKLSLFEKSNNIVTNESSGNCSEIHMITRAQWGARAPKEIVNLTIPVPEFFVHHTDTWECFNVKNCSAAVRSIQKFHMDDRGWDDIGYNFLVGEDGNVYEGRGWDHLGTHTKGFNSKSLGTSVIGNYTAKLPNEKALTALKALIACGVEEKKLYPDFRMYGHRDAGKTECPGDALYKLIQTWPHYSHKPPKTVLV